jgi:hypothetical protein
VTLFAYIALFGWVPLVVVMFAVMPSRRAATVAIIGAWLLLPPYTIPISHFPDYTKNVAATIGVILGTLCFGLDRVATFRLRWFDIPMLAWCSSGIASSLHNGLGLYDGLSNALTDSLYWGLPYLLGRVYFSDFAGLRSFTVAMVIGGLAYVLPCLWEMKMSPQLLGDIYGISSWQGTRLGGFRPHVFFMTGLELGMWMTAASLTAWWLWRCGVLTRLGSVSFGIVILPVLLVTTILCRSSGALILLAGGMVMLWSSHILKTRMLLLALVLVGPIYVTVRLNNLWTGQQLVAFVKVLLGEERGKSLATRFEAEDLIGAKAMQQPIFGWGGWNRAAVYYGGDNTLEQHRVPTDGLWVVEIGAKGLVGLSFLYLATALPAFLFLWRVPERLWRHPQIAAATVAATLLGIYMVDCILNAMINIIYITLAGGLSGALAAPLPRALLGQGRARTDGVSEHLLPDGGAFASGPSAQEIELADRCYRSGRMSKDQGRWNEAEAAWRRALDVMTRLTALAPGVPDLERRWCDCANDLAWLLLNHREPASRSPAAALALAVQAARKCPGAAVYWNTLGAAQFRIGDFKTAVTSLERAIALAGEGTPFDHVFLAMAHARLGHSERAAEWLNRAMIGLEQGYQGHTELARFCEEARSLVAMGPEAPALAH